MIAKTAINAIAMTAVTNPAMNFIIVLPSKVYSKAIENRPAPAGISVSSFLNFRNGDDAVQPIGSELDLVARLDLPQHLRILDRKDHRHTRFVHAKIWDWTVPDRDLIRQLIHLCDLTIYERRRTLRQYTGCQCKSDNKGSDVHSFEPAHYVFLRRLSVTLRQ